MLNCIKADMLRVQRKKSLIAMSLFIIGLFILFTSLIGANILKGDNSTLFKSTVSVVSGFNTILLGIPVFNAIFSDDFKSHSMQVSIGFGISRTKMILARIIEFILIFVEAYAVFTVCYFILGGIINVDMDVITAMVWDLWKDLLLSVCYCCFAMIFVYFAQNGTLGLVVYILLVTSAFTLVFSGIDLIPFLRNHHISIAAITIDGMYVRTFNEQLETAKRVMWGCLLAGCYIIVPMILTNVIFKHKEMDF